MKKRNVSSYAPWADASIAVLTLGAWIWMSLFSPTAAFSAIGLESLKYYTVLSNLFVGIVFGVCSVFRFSNRGVALPFCLKLFKLSAASCVSVTFIVVMIFLGPVFGFDLMFNGSNLIFHLLAPILACVSYLLFEKRSGIALRQSMLCLIPTFLYGFVYLLNVLINGIEGNDFYFFAYWGIPIGFCFFAGILSINFASVQLLRRFSRN